MKKDNRRAFLTKAIALGTASLPLMAMSNEEEFNRDALLPSLKGKKILFIFGGWAGHEPEKFVNYLTPWMKDDGAEVHSFNTLDPYADKGLMDSIDLVIQIFTQGQITKDQERGLLDAIEKNGTGMAGWHGGMCDAFHESQDYQFMTGGQWVAHPVRLIPFRQWKRG